MSGERMCIAPVALRSDAASVERGGYLFRSRGCGDCHGMDGAGAVVVDDGAMHIRAPDITPAPTGVVAGYSPVDWVRTIRHGVKPDGRPVMIMPSEEYNRLVDADLAAIVAYVRQLAPATIAARSASTWRLYSSLGMIITGLPSGLTPWRTVRTQSTGV